jgi:hypothetical protein
VTGRAAERVPDGITPLVGYRAWQVVEEEGGLVFYPLSHRSREWVGATAGWVSSTCPVEPDDLFRLKPGDRPLRIVELLHDAPGERCTCGFYAMKELHPHLLQLVAFAQRAERTQRSDATFVLGRVELAGKVIEHARGYRAERARIVELIPLRGSERHVGSIARRVGVPVAEPVRSQRSLDVGALGWAWRATSRRPGDMSGVAVALWLLAIVAYAAAFVVNPADPASTPFRGIALGFIVLQLVVRLLRARSAS